MKPLCKLVECLVASLFFSVGSRGIAVLLSQGNVYQQMPTGEGVQVAIEKVIGFLCRILFWSERWVAVQCEGE